MSVGQEEPKMKKFQKVENREQVLSYMNATTAEQLALGEELRKLILQWGSTLTKMKRGI